MQSLIPQLAALLAVIVLLNGLWQATSLERTLVIAGGTGLAAYLVLGVGWAVVRHVLAHVPPEEPDPEPAPAESDTPTPPESL